MANKSDISFARRTIKNSTSGTIAGIALCLVGHPFDTLKVRLQTQPQDKPVYKGLVDCFTKTLKWEGLGGLYKGVGSPIVGQMFFRATMFTSYYQFTSILSGPQRVSSGQRMSHAEYFLAGSMTGAVASFVESPIDLFKTKMQIQIIRSKAAGVEPEFRNVFHAGAVIIRQHGLIGAYQGLSATALRNIPACSIYFGSYELVRYAYTPEGGTVNDLKGWQIMLAGGTGGFLYWFLTYPTDVIKSSMQSDDIVKSQRKYKSIIHCATKLYNEGGVRRFFVGLSPCLMRSIPANATMLVVLEKCRQFIEPYL